VNCLSFRRSEVSASDQLAGNCAFLAGQHEVSSLRQTRKYSHRVYLNCLHYTGRFYIVRLLAVERTTDYAARPAVLCLSQSRVTRTLCARILPQIGQGELPSSSFPSHCWLIVPSFDGEKVNLSYWQRRRSPVVRFNIQQFYVLPTQCIYVFCVDLRTNNDYFPIQH